MKLQNKQGWIEDDQRSLFDWFIFAAIHLIVIGGIGYAGYQIYGSRLGFWVGASAAVAGLTSTYLFAKNIPGETLMKVFLGLAVAANAGYLVHNGAKAMGVDSYNTAQVKKFEVGMAQAARATTRSIANSIGTSSKAASQLEKAFDDSVAVNAAILAFIELSLALMFFSIASRRLRAMRQQQREDQAYVQARTADAYHHDEDDLAERHAPPRFRPQPGRVYAANADGLMEDITDQHRSRPIQGMAPAPPSAPAVEPVRPQPGKGLLSAIREKLAAPKTPRRS